MKEARVGIIGFGTVGAGVASCLLENSGLIAKRTGVTLTLTKIADIDITRDRGVKVPPGILTTDAHEAIDECDVIVELVGGTTIAKTFILEALGKGKSVVTANKALLAKHGPELFAAAEKAGADLFYEASVAGGIPIIKSLREGLVADRIDSVHGILNGTCNYILTRMENEGADFEPILKDAQALGYAEANPGLDIDGHDTAHKAAILASLAFGEWVGPESVHVEGIRDISLLDIRCARENGYRIKLLAVIKRDGDDAQVRVHPTLIPATSMLAGVNQVFNGVVVKGQPIGETMFYGRGAGRDATSSAVVADITDIALNLQAGCPRRVKPFSPSKHFGKLLPIDAINTRYYMRLTVVDQPGVVAKISSILGDEGISISCLSQHEGQSADSVSVVVITHTTRERNMAGAVARIERLDVTRDKVKLIRIEDL